MPRSKKKARARRAEAVAEYAATASGRKADETAGGDPETASASGADKRHDSIADTNVAQIARLNIKHHDVIAGRGETSAEVSNERRRKTSIEGDRNSMMARSRTEGRSAVRQGLAGSIADAATASNQAEQAARLQKRYDTATISDANAPIYQHNGTETLSDTVADASAGPNQRDDTETISDADVLARLHTHDVDVAELANEERKEPIIDDDRSEKPKQHPDPETAFEEALQQWRFKRHTTRPWKKRFNLDQEDGGQSAESVLYRAELEVTGYRRMAREVDGTKKDIKELLEFFDGEGFLNNLTVVSEDDRDSKQREKSFPLQVEPLKTTKHENTFMNETKFKPLARFLSPRELMAVALSCWKRSLQKLATDFHLNYTPLKKYDYAFVDSLNYQQLFLLAMHMGLLQEAANATKQIQDSHKRFRVVRNKVVSTLAAKNQLGEMGEEHGRLKQVLMGQLQRALQDAFVRRARSASAAYDATSTSGSDADDERRRSGSLATSKLSTKVREADDKRCESASSVDAAASTLSTEVRDADNEEESDDVNEDDEEESDDDLDEDDEEYLYWQKKKREIEEERAQGDAAILASVHEELITKIAGDETLEFLECRDYFLEECQDMELSVIEVCDILRKEIIPGVDKLL